ncbi:MAG: hypothetical protein A3D92_10660 [Bacteroidetes bacterium RIFCSPHIGHO2_02_FULL_44_7]|nr:MAG: hypothetical protein A3D92_10660 [Bacteroidetes bacterium RIFCSPHIGHO2_02_FULL_44_7]
MVTYPAPVYYEPFDKEAYVEVPEEEIELTPDNILTPVDFNADVKNIARDVDDDRKQSYDNWTANKSVADVEAEYRKLEKQMYEEAGGDKTREQIKKEFDAKKQADLDAARANQNTNTPPTNGGETAFKGSVLADWQLEGGGRTPHQNNDWYIRKPGYMCGRGAGSVTIRIKVNQNGNVTDASYSASESQGANQCMIDNALKYAKMSRFNFSSKTSQSGFIRYTFVSQ